MISIVKASEKDFHPLSELAKRTFIESHGRSAPPADIHIYITEKYSDALFKEELSDPQNIYHLIYDDNRLAGYSKIIFNSPYPASPVKNIAKLERIYVLKKFYNLKIGFKLFQFNIDLSKRNDQTGMWLFVWKENRRAVDFYQKSGFVIIGSHDFKISETHSNPNHQMLLKF